MKNKILKYGFISILIVLIGGYFIFKYLKVFDNHGLAGENSIDSTEIKIRDSIDCGCSKIKARKNLKLGNLIAYYNTQNPYFEELAFRDYGIYVQPIINTAKRTCAIAVMDSAILVRYGNNFFKNIEKEADSINALKPWKGISLDGFNLYSDKEIRYKCGDLNTINKIIVDSLTKKGILPLEQNECIPGELIVDFVITEKGKLCNVRILKRLGTKIDSSVIALLEKLPCDWEPAEKNGEKISYRKRIYLFFGKQPSSGVGLE
jgi:hypothetical protein